MNNTDIQNTKNFNGKIIIAFFAGIVLVYLLVTTILNQRLAELQLETKLLISEQETLLAAIAETTARNGGDEVTERIIRDCSLSERTRFDELLSDLNQTLNQTQLIELERLFGRCGNFFSQRKSVMVSRLQREVEIYETLVKHLDNLTNSRNRNEYNVDGWNQLAELETKQSELFSELVKEQDKIITLLLQGNSPSSEEVQLTIQAANSVQGTLLVTNTQASNIRSTLVSF